MDTKNLKTRKSFTLMELILAVVIAGSLAAMALTSYTRTVRVAYVNDAIRQLTLIHAANQVYKAKNWRYWPNGAIAITDVNTINADLQLNLTNDSLDFFCSGSFSGLTWICQADSAPIHGANSFIVTVVSGTPIGATNPQCVFNCP